MNVAINATETPALMAYRLLRRMMLLQMRKGPRDEPGLSLPQYVDTYLREQGTGKHDYSTRFGDMVRGIGQSAGIPTRDLSLYSSAEFSTIAAKIAKNIEALDPDGDASEADREMAARRASLWPEWPGGWRESMARVAKKEAKREAAKNDKR